MRIALFALLALLSAPRVSAEPPRRRLALVIDESDVAERALFDRLFAAYRARDSVLRFELARDRIENPITKGKLLSDMETCDLVVAVGDGATDFAAAELEDVPVYFVDATVVKGRLLLSPSVAGLFSYSVEDELDAIRALRLGPVGVAFTPGYEPVAEWVRRDAAARGLAVRERMIARKKDLGPAVRALFG
ncbi:MAG TPA: hypothetical protein VH309_11125, partial [Elusimicrobiota bacterium]|nr:hypothetical protein [Elusimicrobiota bacterium]